MIAGPARPVGTYKFESTAGGTSVTFALDFQPKGLARLMDGVITSTMRAEIGNLSEPQVLPGIPLARRQWDRRIQAKPAEAGLQRKYGAPLLM